jgi:hypothetical protein
MKKLHSLAVYGAMAPALALAVSAALAEAPYKPADRTQEQRTTQEQQQRTMPEEAQKERGMATADRAQEQRMAAERAQQHVKAHGTYLSSQPANAFRADELIGSDLKSRPDSETIGEIGDLLIDENGQIVAVIVEVGGFLGLGKKEVAISWDSVEHSLNEKGDGHDFTVSLTKDALKDAPEYKNEASKY